MAASILEIIAVILKIVYSIFAASIAWKEEERQRFEDRIKNLTTILKEAIVNKEEVLNEQDYLSNLEWEKQERYKAYKQICVEVLSSGGGINELTQKDTLGMNLRISEKVKETIAILVQDLNVEDKSKLIAKMLTDL